jgi:cytochrome c oxidase subunit 2
MKTMSPQITRRSIIATAASAVLGSLAAYSIAAPRERTIKVIARKFEFLPGTIKAKKGETLVLKFTAPEVPMGFNLPDFNVRTDILPGKTATVKFVADKTGTFTFVCDIFCGDHHEDMQGTLVVT